jgi:hypothetical protein
VGLLDGRVVDAAEDTVAAINAGGGHAKAYAASIDDPEQDAAIVDASSPTSDSSTSWCATRASRREATTSSTPILPS